MQSESMTRYGIRRSETENSAFKVDRTQVCCSSYTR